MMFATIVPCWKEGIMSIFGLCRTALLAACCIALLTSASSIAQDSPDADTREVSSYVLTESAMEKFAQAGDNLGPIAKQLAGDCDGSDNGEDDMSLDGQVAHISDIPGAAAAIESAGMPVREFMVFSWSMVQSGIAAWILTQPGGELPSGVSMANVDFYRAHEAELKKLSQEMQSGDCQNGDEEYREDEQYSEDGEYIEDQDYAEEDDSYEED
jgi:hypothetical protein